MVLTSPRTRPEDPPRAPPGPAAFPPGAHPSRSAHPRTATDPQESRSGPERPLCHSTRTYGSLDPASTRDPTGGARPARRGDHRPAPPGTADHHRGRRAVRGRGAHCTAAACRGPHAARYLIPAAGRRQAVPSPWTFPSLAGDAFCPPPHRPPPRSHGSRRRHRHRRRAGDGCTEAPAHDPGGDWLRRQGDGRRTRAPHGGRLVSRARHRWCRALRSTGRLRST